MTSDGKPDEQRSAKAPEEGPREKKRQADRNGRKSEPQIGRALRSVYDETVGEAIPREMLDLLGRLG